MTGASMALHLSDIPWAGPYAGVRVGPHRRQVRRQPDLRRARARRSSTWSWPASRDAIVMVEGGCAEVGEDVIVDALMFAHKAAQPLIDLQEKLRAAVGKPKREFVPPVKDPAIVERVRGAGQPEDRSGDGHPRQAASATRRWTPSAPRPRRRSTSEFPDRGAEVERGVRVGQEEAPARAGARHRPPHRRPRHRPTSGRSPARSGVLPRTHGSSLFTRGETQALVTTTLGTKPGRAAHRRRSPATSRSASCCTTTSRRSRRARPSRCAAPAGARSATATWPSGRSRACCPREKDFPYTIRIVSEILESNGSSSMASVCGGIAVADGRAAFRSRRRWPASRWA